MGGRIYMRASRVIFISVLIILAVFVFTQCHNNRKKLSGDYYLDRFIDGGVFYLEDSKNPQQGGILEGVIQELGYNNQWIVAYVLKQYGGDKDGWYVIDVKNKSISGPYVSLLEFKEDDHLDIRSPFTFY